MVTKPLLHGWGCMVTRMVELNGIREHCNYRTNLSLYRQVSSGLEHDWFTVFPIVRIHHVIQINHFSSKSRSNVNYQLFAR